MGKKNRNKGFFKFNCGRFLKAIFAAVVLTVIATELLWNSYYFSFIDDYEENYLAEEAWITSQNLLAYATFDDESFLKEALSGPVAFDYISFRRENAYSETIIYETKFNEAIPELEGAKADYNTKYLVWDNLFGHDQFISSKLKKYIKRPEYNSKPDIVLDSYVEKPEGDYWGANLTTCRAANKLYENTTNAITFKRLIYHDADRHFGRYNGFFIYNDNTYNFDLIVQFKSFTEFALIPVICFFVVILSVSLAIGYFTGLRKYRKYQTELNNLRFKNGLIDALAHNLKTPMQIITVNAANLRDRPTAEKRKKYCDTILSRAKLMNEMVDTINSAVERDPVESVFGVKDAVNEAAAKLGVRLEISDDTNIKADREYFIQAVYNLIDNAAQYGLKGSPIKVEIKNGKMIISNHTESAKFTPGTGIAIADRFLTRTGMLLTLDLDDGLFKAVIEFGFY